MTAEVTGRVDLEVEVVAAVCRAATRSVGGHRSDVDVVVDPLDATVWVHLPAPAVHPAVAGLRARGWDAVAVNDHRVHVTGWEVRLLRWRLGGCSRDRHPHRVPGPDRRPRRLPPAPPRRRR